jgi:hypothetical protein
MSQELVAALIGLLVGAAAAWVRAVLAIREKVNEELRGRRIDAYPAVYRLTAALSLWPPARMNYEELFQLTLHLRQWYFTTGGLYLSARSRERYGEMKQLISAYLDEFAKEHEEEEGEEQYQRSAHHVPPAVYDDLTITARAFRNSLTEDLETRRQRSLLWVVRSRQQHRKQHQLWSTLINKVGGPDREVRPYPLEKMPLPGQPPTLEWALHVGASALRSRDESSQPAERITGRDEST